jgi:hypothetical protein
MTQDFPLYDKQLFEDWLDRFNQDDVLGADADEEVSVEKDYEKYFRFIQKISGFNLKDKQENNRPKMQQQYRQMLFLLEQCPFIDNFSVITHVSYDMPHQDFVEERDIPVDEYEDFLNDAISVYSKEYYFRYDIGIDVSDTTPTVFNDWLHLFWKNMCKHSIVDFCYEKWFGACNKEDIRSYHEVDRIHGKTFDCSGGHFFDADEVQTWYKELFGSDDNILSDAQRARYNRYENGRIHMMCHLDWLDKHPESFPDFEVKWHGHRGVTVDNHMNTYDYVYLIPKKPNLTTDDAGKFLQDKLLNAFSKEDMDNMNANEVMSKDKVPQAIIYAIVPDDMKRGKNDLGAYFRKVPKQYNLTIMGVLLDSYLYSLFCNPAYTDPVVKLQEFERIGKNTEQQRRKL